MHRAHILKRQFAHSIVLACAAAALGIIFFYLTENLKDRLYARAVEVGHTHPDLGYAFTAPPSWVFDTSRTIARADILRHTSGKAVIFIEAIEDPAFASDAGIFAMERKIKNDFAQQSRYSLESFETIMWKKHPAFRMNGRRGDDAETWKFTQYVVFTPNQNRAYNITATVSDSLDPSIGKNAEKIISTIILPPSPAQQP